MDPMQLMTLFGQNPLQVMIANSSVMPTVQRGGPPTGATPPTPSRGPRGSMFPPAMSGAMSGSPQGHGGMDTMRGAPAASQMGSMPGGNAIMQPPQSMQGQRGVFGPSQLQKQGPNWPQGNHPGMNQPIPNAPGQAPRGQFIPNAHIDPKIGAAAGGSPQGGMQMQPQTQGGSPMQKMQQMAQQPPQSMLRRPQQGGGRGGPQGGGQGQQGGGKMGMGQGQMPMMGGGMMGA